MKGQWGRSNFRRLGVHCALLLAIGLCLTPAPSVAQMHGVVRDDAGAPLNGVLVEVWGPEARLGSQLTGPDGNFRVTAANTLGATGLTFSRIGYRPETRSTRASDSSMIVVMLVAPVRLPELRVGPGAPPCPNTDDARARQVWAVSARGYAQDTSRRGRSARWLQGEEYQVLPARVGVMDESRLTTSDSRWVGATDERTEGRYRNVEPMIARGGYAWETGLQSPRWRFPALESMDAHHFASESFGLRHNFSIVAEEPGGTTLVFCPRTVEQPTIEGQLEVSPEGALISARWSFNLPGDGGEAGGEVIFVPTLGHGESLPHLLAARGMFWSRFRADGERYFQRARIFTAWRVSPDGTMPPLPP